MSLTVTKLITANELLAMPDDGYRYELVKGEVIRMSPAGDEHGEITMRISSPLFVHVSSNNLGKVYAAETGFLIEHNPDTVRAPDVAFVSNPRVKATGRLKGFRVGAPDLAVEVNSPNDTIGQVESKVKEWLEAGARMVWVVSPRLHTVTVYHSLSDVVVLTALNTIEGGDVVPGFRLPVSQIFEDSYSDENRQEQA